MHGKLKIRSCDGRTTDGKDGGGGGDGKLGSRPEGKRKGGKERGPRGGGGGGGDEDDPSARGKAILSFSNFNCANRRRPLPYIAGRLSPPKPSYLKLKMNEVSQTVAEMNCQSVKPQSIPDATFGDSQIQTNCWLVNAKFFLNMHNLLRSALGLWPLFCSPADLVIPSIPSSVRLRLPPRRWPRYFGDCSVFVERVSVE